MKRVELIVGDAHDFVRKPSGAELDVFADGFALDPAGPFPALAVFLLNSFVTVACAAPATAINAAVMLEHAAKMMRTAAERPPRVKLNVTLK